MRPQATAIAAASTPSSARNEGHIRPTWLPSAPVAATYDAAPPTLPFGGADNAQFTIAANVSPVLQITGTAPIGAAAAPFVARPGKRTCHPKSLHDSLSRQTIWRIVIGKNEWQIQEAKGKFSAVLSQAQSAGPQQITKHGQPIAVILSQRDYERLTRVGGTSIVEFFANSPLSRLELPERNLNDVGRDVEF